MMYRTNYSLWTDKGIFDAVQDERDRQDQKWGADRHQPDGTGRIHDEALALSAKYVTSEHTRAGTVTWRDILWEEVLEAFAETEWSKLREELIQSMAVIAAWIEDGDGRKSNKSTVDKLGSNPSDFTRGNIGGSSDGPGKDY
jgi:hypothetical protein